MIDPITNTLVVVIAMILSGALFIVKQEEKGAVLRLGKIIKTVEPGLNFRIPIIDTVTKVDMRTQTVDLIGQSAITKDNISVGVDAVVFMIIESSEKIITQIVNYRDAVSKYAQTAKRNIIGQYNLDDLLESREEIAIKLKEEIDKLAKDWGINVTRAGLQDISFPQDMKRAFAVQAEAERESKPSSSRQKRSSRPPRNSPQPPRTCRTPTPCSLESSPR